MTPFRADERYAAGDYPNQRRTADGVAAWTRQQRPVADTDLVVWYSFGHTHIPRPEEWPGMAAHKIGFMLKPDGFFDANPALDLAPSESRVSCCSD